MANGNLKHNLGKDRVGRQLIMTSKWASQHRISEFHEFPHPSPLPNYRIKDSPCRENMADEHFASREPFTLGRKTAKAE